MRIDLIESLIKKYESDKAIAYSNILTYIENPVGVGEHSCIVETLEEQVKKYNDANELLQTTRILREKIDFD